MNTKTPVLTQALINEAAAAGSKTLTAFAAQYGIQAKGMADAMILKALNNKMKATTGKLTKEVAAKAVTTNNVEVKNLQVANAGKKARAKKAAKPKLQVEIAFTEQIAASVAKREEAGLPLTPVQIVDLKTVHTVAEFNAFMDSVKEAGKKLVTMQGKNIATVTPETMHSRPVVTVAIEGGKKAPYYLDSKTHHISRYVAVA